MAKELKTSGELAVLIREGLNSPNAGLIDVYPDEAEGFTAVVMTRGTDELQTRVSQIVENLRKLYDLKPKD